MPQSNLLLDCVLLSMVSAAPPPSWHVVLLHLSVPATPQQHCCGICMGAWPRTMAIICELLFKWNISYILATVKFHWCNGLVLIGQWSQGALCSEEPVLMKKWCR